MTLGALFAPAVCMLVGFGLTLTGIELAMRRLERQPPDAQPYDATPIVVAAVGGTSTVLLSATAGVWSLQSRRRRAVESRLADSYRQSRYDSLTGLPNRAHLMEWLETELACERPDGRLLGLMFIDVDRFKAVNDTMGHAVGDELLKEVARRLAGSVRSGDLVARLAGDEFVIACPGVTTSGKLADMAERVLSGFETPVELRTGPFYTRLSIGLAVARGSVIAPHTLLEQADAAMYVAKGTSGSRYAFFDEELRAQADARHAIAQALQLGLDAGELALHYQPVVRLPEHLAGGPAGEVVAVEAFIRWNRPGHGLLTPAAFLDVAEESGLIGPLGRLVVADACRQAVRWNGAGAPSPVPVAVNVSGRQLLAPDFATGVEAALGESGLAPQLLHLELTEAVALDPRVRGSGVLEHMRGLGVGLVIDDFGRRHGSLGLLKELEVTMVKIHGSTANRAATEPAEAAIVSAVVSLAEVLEAEVVGEAVETEEQLAVLAALGVRCVQGHLLLPPVPGSELDPIATDRSLSGLRTVLPAPARAETAP